MTLLSIVQDAADEVKATSVTSVIGNADPDVQLLLRCANKVGVRLMTAATWQALRKEKTFTAVAGEAQANVLPDDFNRFVSETFWDRTNRYLVSGPVEAARWQGLKANSYSGPDKKFIHRGNALHFLPAFAGGEECAFEYVSDEWCTDSSGVTGRSAWADDTDISLINEELVTLGVVYEYLESEGQPSKAAAMHYEDRFKQLQRNDQPRPNILVAGDIFGGGRHYTGHPATNRTSNIID